MNLYQVLFVCTGNTCRSPMAEELLRSKIERRGMSSRLGVSSAGISAWEGQTAAPEACSVMASRGLALENHRSRQVQAERLAAADLVLVMTRSHRQRLEEGFSGLRDKLFLLGEYAGRAGEVPDPIGGTLLEYERCASLLDRFVEDCWEKILTAAGKKANNGEK